MTNVYDFFNVILDKILSDLAVVVLFFPDEPKKIKDNIQGIDEALATFKSSLQKNNQDWIKRYFLLLWFDEFILKHIEFLLVKIKNKMLSNNYIMNTNMIEVV